MRGIRVVLDTNCILSGLLFSTKLMAWLRISWQRGDVIPIVCRETVLELIRVLTYPKFKLTSVEQEVLLADFLPYTQTVIYAGKPSDNLVLRDPKDQVFLGLAISSQVVALVTGDQDLLGLKNQAPIAIMTVAEFQIALNTELASINGE
jgi:uncharacterized protein